MDNIICDLCGTAYDDTLQECPICGAAKPEVPAASAEAGDSYSHVRGGRFSKSNAGKRTAPAAPAPKSKPRTAQQKPEGDPNKGLLIVVVVLLLIIVSVCAYIAIRFVDLSQMENSTGTTSTGAIQQIPCTAVSLSQTELVFDSANMTILLQLQLIPADTTDKVIFLSSNEEIVTVDADGMVKPKADGEAFITVICGGVSTQIPVNCSIGVDIPVDPTVPSDPTTPTTPSNPVWLTLNRVEFTLSGYGSSWDLTRNSPDPYYPGFNYSGPEDPSEIVWTSENPEVATVENGVVTAVGKGHTIIYAEYGGRRVSCRVSCVNVVVPPVTDYRLTHTDVTIDVGERFHLELLQKTDQQKVQSAVFRSEDPAVAEVDASGWVTGVSTGTIIIYVDYEGITYECTVRVVVR